MPFNAHTNLTSITGYKNSDDLEQRVERCIESGFVEVGRADHTTVGKYFDTRRRFRYTEEYLKQTVYLRRIEKETNQ